MHQSLTKAVSPNSVVILPRERSDLNFNTQRPQPQPLTVLQLLAGLRRCWPSALGVGSLVGFIFAAALWLFLPPSKPFAYAKILFPSNPDRLRFEHPDPPLKEQTQKERILSRKILSKVVENPEVAELEMIKERPDPVSFLARELQIDFPSGSEIMKITMHGDHAQELTTLVNGVKNTYLDEVSDESENRRGKRENDLRLHFGQADQAYAKALELANKRGRGVGSADPQTIAFKQQRIESDLYQTDGEIRSCQIKIKNGRKEMNDLNKRLAEPIDVHDPSYEPIFLTDDEVGLLTKQKREAERKLIERKRLAMYFGKDVRERVHRKLLQRQ